MKKRLLILTLVVPVVLMGIVLATSTMNPRITYTGNGIPDPSVGRTGDLYVDLDTSILYIMGTDGWAIFAVLPAPVNGTDGLDGATWIVRDTAPTDSLGSNGDLYFNYVSFDIFHKVDGTWIYLTTIAGQQGPAGTDGTNGINGTDGQNGSAWYNELVAPMTSELGFDGDYYLFTNGTTYYKMNGTWMYLTSLIGPQGSDGSQGKTGLQGETGATGASGATGPPGIAGANGLNGADGSTGPKGSDAPWWVYILLSATGGGVAGAVTVQAAKRNRKKKQ